MATEFPDTAGQTKRWRRRIVLVLFAAVAIPVGASIVYTFPPSQYHFYPRCVLFSLTGLYCAGCGATRCVGALLHGNVQQAFAYNPLFLVLLPYIAFAVCGQIVESWTGKKVPFLRLPHWLILVLVVVLIAYSIARNIGVYPFNLLAPHEL